MKQTKRVKIIVIIIIILLLLLMKANVLKCTFGFPLFDATIRVYKKNNDKYIYIYKFETKIYMKIYVYIETSITLIVTSML